MTGTRTRKSQALITSAGRGHTLDVEARTRRYLITMAVRTVCFMGFLFLPGWWKVGMLAGAVLLPAIAVLLANNSDHRPPPLATTVDEEERRALPPAEVIKGVVEDET